MTTDEEPRRALAAAVVNRRAELELTTVAVAERAGISRTTLHAIENGQRSKLLARTLAQLDRALEWQTGTCRALAQNLEVPPMPTPTDRTTDQIMYLSALMPRLTAAERERVIGYAEALRDTRRPPPPHDGTDRRLARTDRRLGRKRANRDGGA